MFRRRGAAALACVAVLAAASLALAGQRTDAVVRALERNLSRRALTRLGDRELLVLDRPGIALWLRPQTRTIGVAQGMSLHGFTLGAGKTLSPAERGELARILEARAPDTSTRSVLRALRTSIAAHRQRERRLVLQDPLIQDILRRAAEVRGQGDVVLWQGRGGSLVYRPGPGTLVGESAMQHQGFFLERGASGLNVQREHLEGLRVFLERHAPR